MLYFNNRILQFQTVAKLLHKNLLQHSRTK